MKQCTVCNRTYPDDAQLFCLEDGAQLVQAGGASHAFDPNATLALGQARDTNPPPENLYQQRPQPPAPSPSWSPPAYTAPQAQASGSKTWLVFAIAGVAVLALGIVALLAIIGRNSSDSPTPNQPVASGPNAPSSVLKDDFSAENWPTGEQGFGNFYQDGQYHMKGRPNLYLYMFPLNKGGNSLLNYSSRDATVKVTARSVDGKPPTHGYGLIIHGKLSAKRNLEGYGFLVYSGEGPKFSIVRFSDGVPTDIVDWESSNVIRSGTNPNQIEVRAQGSQLSFYVNGQFLKSVTDTANMTDGYVGLYTSETNEVAFDDMEIDRQ